MTVVTSNRREAKNILLKSLLSSPKTFSIGRCDIHAITLGLEMAKDGEVLISKTEISITEKGRKTLEEANPNEI